MKTNKLLLGCGIGCGAIFLLVLLSFASGAFWVRNTLRGFQDAVDLRTSLEEHHGRVDEFVPPTDGSISPVSMEAFLSVRESLRDARLSIAEIFGNFPMSEAEARQLEEQPLLQKMRSVFRIGGSAFRLAGTFGNFYAVRNQALLDHDLGMGEYTYIYVLGYYSWLGHSPNDGPLNAPAQPDGIEPRRRDGPRFVLGMGDRIRRNIIQILRNQLETLEGGAPDTESWRAMLAAEIERLEDEADRLPWADGLPKAIAASLEPYRGRLEVTYSPATNPFELAQNRRQGRFSIRAE